MVNYKKQKKKAKEKNWPENIALNDCKNLHSIFIFNSYKNCYFNCFTNEKKKKKKKMNS